MLAERNDKLICENGMRTTGVKKKKICTVEKCLYVARITFKCPDV